MADEQNEILADTETEEFAPMTEEEYLATFTPAEREAYEQLVAAQAAEIEARRLTRERMAAAIERFEVAFGRCGIPIPRGEEGWSYQATVLDALGALGEKVSTILDRLDGIDAYLCQGEPTEVADYQPAEEYR